MATVLSPGNDSRSRCSGAAIGGNTALDAFGNMAQFMPSIHFCQIEKCFAVQIFLKYGMPSLPEI
jgi:hypothetical protein